MATEEPKRSKIILPNGAESPATHPSVTERGKSRQQEDERYVPVIIKRSDESRPHPDDILEHAIAEGAEQLKRPLISLALSSIAAGLILGFTAMAVGVVIATDQLEQLPFPRRLATALVYPLGFIICIMSGSQLFTEHTATAVYPVLDRKSSLWRLLRLWGVVIVGNLVGAIISAALLTAADAVVHARSGYAEIGRHLVLFPAPALLVSSLLAGWLMALGAWLSRASTQTGAQIVCIYIVTFLIGIGGLHHSIAGSVELFTAALVTGDYTAPQIAYFLAVALFGNMIGGSCFVAVLNYAHIRKTQESPGDAPAPPDRS
jgi:formate/nitrite transporter FocA (FNT family)